MKTLSDLVRVYVRETNEYRWDVSTKKNTLLDKPGMEQSDKDNVENYLKSMGLMEPTNMKLSQRESLFREYIRELLVELATWGEEWLSPEVVQFLISTYAEKSPVLGKLTWEYGKLPGRTWGKYVHRTRKLYVNQAKTKNKFKQQISTVLHEIQHWNQHVKCSLEERSPAARSRYSDDPAAAATHDFSAMCARNKWEHGYWDSPHEIDARQFAADNLQDALYRASKFVSGKLEVEDVDEAWDDILDELTEYDAITRQLIGKELSAYDMNSPKNMQLAIQKLKELGMSVR